MKALEGTKECPSCGDNHKSKCLYFYENGWYCFSCGYTKAADRGFSLKPVLDESSIEMPACILSYESFSIECQKWLTKYNITSSLVREHKIGFVEPNFLIMPNIKNNKLLGYQKRNIKERYITTYGQKIPFVLKSLISSNTLVLVEDFISCIRVSQTMDCACLWGTKVSPDYLKKWFTKYDNILVWLDNDQSKETNSGQESANIIIKNCNYQIACYNYKRGFGSVKKSVYNIVTEKDPKCYLDSEIREIISGEHAYVTIK